MTAPAATHRPASARPAEAARPAGAESESRAERVLAQIRDGIHAGRYKPGERVRETEVADWLGVSRTPVREALRRLESAGLVVFEPWRGAVVADLDRQQINELYAMREVLEGAAARLAARHIDEAELDVLAVLLDRADAAADDPDALAAINRTFHETLQRAARNRYLTETLEQLRNALALLRGTTFAVTGRPETAAAEHRAIVAAIGRRDADAAEAAARDHIRAAQKARLRLLLDEDSA